jgi:L-alanine-DL-glutamate epimerase-like enolase superfamily enzyme
MPDPRIEAVEAIPVVVAGLRDFRISEGQTRTHVSVIVRLRADDGVEGYGEIVSAPPGKPEEFLEEIVGAVERYAAPALLGLRVEDRAAANARVADALKGRVWTKAGIANALCDLHAKTLGVPVSTLIGGRNMDDVPVMGMVIGMMTPEDMADIAAGEVGAGYGTIKIKIGEDIPADVKRVAAVREAIGDAVKLRVDANDHYCPADAIRLIRAIERYDLDHVEQPVSRYDVLGSAQVQANVGVPVMTDDMVATPEDAMNVIRLRAANRVKLKVTKHGMEGTLMLARMLESAGIPCVLGHVFEMGLAAVAEAHVAAVCPNLVMPTEIGSLKPMGVSDDVILEKLIAAPGKIHIPVGAGFGVTPDWDRIEGWAPAAAT